MSRLIEADALIKYIPAEEIVSKMAITNAPAIDAVEVVRCEDCEYWRAGSRMFDYESYCELTATRCDGNHFCSWGEKSVLRNQN